MNSEQETSSNRLDPYELALKEVESDNKVAGAWARAMVESNGDEAKCKAAYIRIRVNQQEQDTSSFPKSIPPEAVFLAPEHALLAPKLEKPEAASREPAKTAPFLSIAEKKELKGVGGWLALLVASMIVIGPIFMVFTLVGKITGIEMNHPSLVENSMWWSFKSMTWLFMLFSVVLSIWGGWGLFSGNDWSRVKRAVAIIWINGPGASFIYGVLIPAFTMPAMINGAGAQIVGNMLGAAIGAAVWTAYLYKSKRVNNTYPKKDLQAELAELLAFGNRCAEEGKLACRNNASRTSNPYISNNTLEPNERKAHYWERGFAAEAKATRR